MHVLLCGSAGYVGSALTLSLRRSHRVTEVDIGWFADIPYPTDYGTLTARDLDGVDAVVVLAGHSSLHMCEGQERSAFLNNVANLRNLLSISGERQVIYASTSALYGSRDDLVDERAAIVPSSEYDMSKWAAERAAQASGQPVVCLRFGTVCGPSPRMRRDLMLNRMIYEGMALGRLQVTPVSFWRPVLDVHDLCRAVEAILAAPPRAGAYHLASFNSRLHDLASNVAAILEVPVEVATAGGSPFSMRLNTAAFARDYAFTFHGTCDSIAKDLRANWPTFTHWTDRSLPKAYDVVTAIA